LHVVFFRICAAVLVCVCAFTQPMSRLRTHGGLDGQYLYTLCRQLHCDALSVIASASSRYILTTRHPAFNIPRRRSANRRIHDWICVTIILQSSRDRPQCNTSPQNSRSVGTEGRRRAKSQVSFAVNTTLSSEIDAQTSIASCIRDGRVGRWGPYAE